MSRALGRSRKVRLEALLQSPPRRRRESQILRPRRQGRAGLVAVVRKMVTENKIDAAAITGTGRMAVSPR